MKAQDKNKKREPQRIANPLRPQLLSLKDAAQYLGLSDWALRERVWAGALPFVRFPGRDGKAGKKMFFHLPDLDAFIEENKCKYV